MQHALKYYREYSQHSWKLNKREGRVRSKENSWKVLICRWYRSDVSLFTLSLNNGKTINLNVKYVHRSFLAAWEKLPRRCPTPESTRLGALHSVYFHLQLKIHVKTIGPPFFIRRVASSFNSPIHPFRSTELVAVDIPHLTGFKIWPAGEITRPWANKLPYHGIIRYGWALTLPTASPHNTWVPMTACFIKCQS
jgi:hypothetical protein